MHCLTASTAYNSPATASSSIGISLQEAIITSFFGLSPTEYRGWIIDISDSSSVRAHSPGRVAVFSMPLTISMPSTTVPNTTCYEIR